MSNNNKCLQLVLGVRRPHLRFSRLQSIMHRLRQLTNENKNKDEERKIMTCYAAQLKYSSTNWLFYLR